MVIESSQFNDIRRDAGADTIALRVGCFDLLHEGHGAAVSFAADQADHLVVGVMSDDHIRKLKGPERPIQDELTRANALLQLEQVEYTFVVPDSFLGRLRMWRELRPDVYVQHTEVPLGLAKRRFLGKLGISCIEDSGEKLDSTTDMLARMGINSAIRASKLWAAKA